MDKIVIEESSLISADIAAFLNLTGFLIPNWKWLVLILAFLLGFFLHYAFKFILRQIKKHNPIANRYPDSFTGHIMRLPIERPIAWILTILFWIAAIDATSLPAKVDLWLTHILQGFLAINVIVVLAYAVDAMRDVMIKVSQKNANSYNFSGQLIPYGAKALKVLIIILGVLIALQSFGLNVVSLLAGLGLGGLALALAAQDTAANVFGSITIMFDNPFKVGDIIKMNDVEGTVEEIGFRSTRVRTFYNSLVAIPNAMIAKEMVDNMGARPARRVRQLLSITYETPTEKIVQFCDQVREAIKAHKNVVKDNIIVNLDSFADSWLVIVVNCHIYIHPGDEEPVIKQEIFLKILDVAAQMKVDFAYPTNMTYQRHIEPPIHLETNSNIEIPAR